MIQWVRICLAMQGTCVQSLVGELRSHMPQEETPKCCIKRYHMLQIRPMQPNK